MIYLDNASTTKVDESVKELIDKYLYENYGNAGSTHSFGAESKQALNKARSQVASAVSTSPENIIFTSGGSESNTLAIVGLANYLKKCDYNHIITTKYEHHSVLNAMKEMERLGFEVTYLDVSNGVVQYKDFVASVREDTGLTSIMYINNELGTKNEIKTIYDFCKQRGILFHSDCVQATDTEDIKLGEIADMISISGHKLHAPKGVGCLCTLHKYCLSNIIFGGQQEFGIRPSTENIASIVALGQIMENLSQNREEVITKINLISQSFKEKLFRLCDENNIELEYTISPERSTSKICSVRFKDIDAETLTLMLGERGVCISAGAACSSNSSEPSHVLKAIGLTDEQARSTIRISFSDYNTVDEVCCAAEIIVDCIKILKMI